MRPKKSKIWHPNPSPKQFQFHLLRVIPQPHIFSVFLHLYLLIYSLLSHILHANTTLISILSIRANKPKFEAQTTVGDQWARSSWIMSKVQSKFYSTFMLGPNWVHRLHFGTYPHGTQLCPSLKLPFMNNSKFSS